MTSRHWLATTVIALLLMSSCSTDADAPLAGSSPTAQSLALHAAEAVPIPASAYEAIYQEPLVQAGVQTGVLAVGEDGTILLESQKAPVGLTLEDVTLVVRSSDDGAVTIPSPRRPRTTQVTFGALNEDWVVWKETTSTEVGSVPWVIYAYDRGTKQTVEIERSQHLDRQVTPGPGPAEPVLAGDHLLWSRTTGTVSAESDDIYGCDLTDCTPTRYATGAAQLFAVGDSLYAVTDSRAGATAKTGSAIVKIDVRSKRSQLAENLDANGGKSSFVASRRAKAWVMSGGPDPDQVVIRDLETDRTITVEAENFVEQDFAARFGYPVATERFVAWGATGSAGPEVGNYLYDLDKGTLYSLGNRLGLYSVDASGDYVSWREYRGASDTPENLWVTVAKLR